MVREEATVCFRFMEEVSRTAQSPVTLIPWVYTGRGLRERRQKQRERKLGLCNGHAILATLGVANGDLKPHQVDIFGPQRANFTQAQPTAAHHLI